MEDKVYQDIQEIIRRLRVLENKFNELERRVAILEAAVAKYDETMLSEQDVRELIEKVANSIPIKPHDHKSLKQGGDAFAALGGNLI
ncbi:MAG: hypothetical protein ACFFAU_01255 [Candidatus Hodarchaeota archaeon]